MAEKTKTARRKDSLPQQDTESKQLVIVESPAKARTLNKYLGNDYVVMASVGHVRDLPDKNPKGVKDPVPGVDLDRDFTPTYEIIKGKAATVAHLRQAAKKADGIWLATDMDREGEAIAWHLMEALKIPPQRAKRVVFNAITKSEVQKAFQNPRQIEMGKVNAQQARRVLDRIVGYQVSPLLWKKVAGGLSAGRVQSVAVRLVVEREREIEVFVPEEYWRIPDAEKRKKTKRPYCK
jgi:DNA topoisomerase-1